MSNWMPEMSRLSGNLRLIQAEYGWTETQIELMGISSAQYTSFAEGRRENFACRNLYWLSKALPISAGKLMDLDLCALWEESKESDFTQFLASL